MDTAAELENARALLRLGRHKAAAEICQRILERRPERPDALLLLGTIAAELGDSTAAAGFLTRIVDRDPAYPGAAVQLGDVLARIGETAGAVAWYEAAIALERDTNRAAPALARLHAARGDFDAVLAVANGRSTRESPSLALEIGRIGRAAAPAHGGLALVTGRAMVALGMTGDARAPLRAAIADRPGEPDAAFTLGQALGGDVAWLGRSLAIRPTADARAALGEALARSGRAGEARAAFDAVLAADGAHGHALRGLARLHLAFGEADAAIGLARRRLAISADDGEAARILGEALTRRGLAASAIAFAQGAARAGRSGVARSTAEGIVGAEPERLDALGMIGTPRAFRRVLALAPATPSAMSGLASTGDRAGALAWLERAIRLDGSMPTAFALARALIPAGARERAKALLQPMLGAMSRQRPAQAAELAGLLVDLGEAEPAVRLLEAVIQAQPEDAPLARQLIEAQARFGDAAALARIGQAHLVKRRAGLAAAAFAAARKIKPDSAQIAFLHGRALWDEGDKSAAVDAFVDAAELAGDDNLDLLSRAGEALVGLQATELGLRYISRAVDLDFANPGRHTYSYFFNFLNQCDWPARLDYVDRLTRLAEAKIAADDPEFRINPSLWVFLAAERDLLYRSANHFARHSFPGIRPRMAPASGGDPERPIRLGYFSAFLHGHHIGYSLRGILAGHDRREVQIHLYGQSRDDSIQAALKEQAQVFRSIDGKSPAAIAQMIAADGIDVLVDLDGYVNSASGLLTIETASHRPAPIQMLYHNYVGPTGTDFIDYVVADRELLDAHDDAGYRERLIRLPPCYYPAAPLPKADVTTDRRSWGLPERGMVFCNFGHFYKVEATSFDAWMRILRQVPGSVLWMNHWDTPRAVANLRREAEARGVDGARLVFSALADKPMHLARLGLADLFLDTFVYASGVTSLDALWGGVPVLTVRGSTFARRVGASLNAGIGLEDLTCPDVPAFERLAGALAADPARLATLKARLRANLGTHPLFDQARLARNLERAYRVAFRRHVAGLPPESFELAP